ncbi:protein IMPACT-B-like isoform X2 [Portunus trituberculatus]|uniref:protein IMPACT-B-like isoform X2 n=1 Tax=Portunus trituberculatus TaxID=210409 RepID=UPI001E1D1AD6|nr:protein IMPACT-B-like isoform X2 [Portunus trituberculatus]
MADDNLARQNDEIEALASIYGTDFHTESAEHRTYSVEVNEARLSALLQVTMPSDYPAEAPPTYSLSAPWLKGLRRQELCGHLEDIYLENTGESIVYLWVERIRQFMVEFGEEEEEQESQTKEVITLQDTPKEPTEDMNCPEIFSGEIISDRKSVFQPHLAAVHCQAQVGQVLRKLYENKKIANATHNMYAYRFLADGSSHVTQDCEDDGEDHAGGRMLHLLQILDVVNVMVVVTRWYGGIHLGPDRFKHINNAARQILDSCGYIIPRQDDNKKKKKGK